MGNNWRRATTAAILAASILGAPTAAYAATGAHIVTAGDEAGAGETKEQDKGLRGFVDRGTGVYVFGTSTKEETRTDWGKSFIQEALGIPVKPNVQIKVDVQLDKDGTNLTSESKDVYGEWLNNQASHMVKMYENWEKTLNEAKAIAAKKGDVDKAVADAINSTGTEGTGTLDVTIPLEGANATPAPEGEAPAVELPSEVLTNPETGEKYATAEEAQAVITAKLSELRDKATEVKAKVDAGDIEWMKTEYKARVAAIGEAGNRELEATRAALIAERDAKMAEVAKAAKTAQDAQSAVDKAVQDVQGESDEAGSEVLEEVEGATASTPFTDLVSGVTGASPSASAEETPAAPEEEAPADADPEVATEEKAPEDEGNKEAAEEEVRAELHSIALDYQVRIDSVTPSKQDTPIVFKGSIVASFEEMEPGDQKVFQGNGERVIVIRA